MGNRKSFPFKSHTWPSLCTWFHLYQVPWWNCSKSYRAKETPRHGPLLFGSVCAFLLCYTQLVGFQGKGQQHPGSKLKMIRSLSTAKRSIYEDRTGAKGRAVQSWLSPFTCINTIKHVILWVWMVGSCPPVLTSLYVSHLGIICSYQKRKKKKLGSRW